MADCFVKVLTASTF